MALTVTTTTTEDVTIAPDLKTKLMKRLKVYAERMARKEALEKSLLISREEIELIRETIGATSLNMDGFKITRVTSVRKKFFLQRLLNMGVSAEMWNECHDEVPGKPYTRITLPGAKEHEENE